MTIPSAKGKKRKDPSSKTEKAASSETRNDGIEETVWEGEGPPWPTTVVYEYSSGGGGGGGGGVSAPAGRIAVGDPVDGGGVVVAVTSSSVTVQFRGGAPEGPVRLPGIETTVIEQTSSTGQSGIATAPWGPGDKVTSSIGMYGYEEGMVTSDELHTRYRLRCPGTVDNSYRLPYGTRELLNPTNTGSCRCALLIGSLDADGHVVGQEVKLGPGKSIPVYKLEPGAVSIVAVCSGGCHDVGCYGELTISRSVA